MRELVLCRRRTLDLESDAAGVRRLERLTAQPMPLAFPFCNGDAL